MKKTIMAGLFAASLVAIPVSGFAIQTIDSPHLDLDGDITTENCSKCHFAADAYTCESCHGNAEATGPYGAPEAIETNAPYAKTHGGAAPTYSCTVCHNPHVSLQYNHAKNANNPALASGQATVSSTGTNTITFNITVDSGSAWADPTIWSDKTGKDSYRGLTFWVGNGAGDDLATTGHDESLDKFSFEVTAATATTVTVKGSVPANGSIADNSTYEVHYGQLIARAVNPQELNADNQPANYRDANATTDAVTFPMVGGLNLLVDTTGTANDGICQICHSGTVGHWNNTGNDGHNAGTTCTVCHTHGSGFMVTACNACHPGALRDGAPATGSGTTQLAQGGGTTGSVTPGMHTIHVDTYGYLCERCHTGSGMNSSDPDNIGQGNGIDIGFGAPVGAGYLAVYDGQTPVTYVPQNNSDVVAPPTGAMQCSNVYCHSDGYSAGYIEHDQGTTAPPKSPVSTQTSRSHVPPHAANVSPAWDGSSPDPQGDGIKCNNCHNNYALVPRDTDGWDLHDVHVTEKHFKCMTCHYATTTDPTNQVITNYGNHVNGYVDIMLNPQYASGSGGIGYVSSTKSCLMGGVNTGYCHGGGRVWVTLNTNATATDDVAYAPDTVICSQTATVPIASNYLNHKLWDAPNAEKGAINYDPVPVLSAEQISSNVMRLTDNSYDIDNVDSVNKYCFGGGHDGSLGKAKITTAMAGKVIPKISYDGTPQYHDIVVSDSMKNTTDFPGQTVVWYQGLYYDNNPMTTANRQAKTQLVPELMPIDGHVDDPWKYVVWDNNFDDSNVNTMAEIVSISTPVIVNNGDGTCSASLTVQAIDPDGNVAGKDAAICGTGAHGHDGTTESRVKVYFNSSSAVVAKAILDNSDPNVTWNAPLETTTAPCTGGLKFWYFVEVFDAHRQDPVCRDSGFTMQTESGWLSVTTPAP